MRRDPRGFLAVRWSLVEGTLGANLAREARGRLGYSPALGLNAVGGVHFLTEAGRAVAFTHPPEPHESLVAMARTLIEAKHSVDQVERVAMGALPPTVQSTRRKLVSNPTVSVWPEEFATTDRLPVVIEHLTGGYLHHRAARSIMTWSMPAPDVNEAAVFENVEEAREWLAHREFHEPVALRYLAAARADQDQRDAALSP